MVEDDIPSRQLLVRRLNREGWQTLEAEDGPRALEIYAAQPSLAAVLLDMGLPGMDGLTVLQHLRQSSTPHSLPVIMVTAFDEKDYLAKALESGANDYIKKPIEFAILKARLNVHLQYVASNHLLNHLHARQELILRGANDGIWEWDIEKQLLTHSQTWLDLLQISDTHTFANLAQWLARIHPEDQSHVEEHIQRFLNDSAAKIINIQYRMRKEDGHYVWIHTRGATDRNVQGHCQFLAGTHTDISKERYVHRVTGLANMACLTDTIESLQKNTAQKNFAVLLFHFSYLENYQVLRNEYRKIIMEISAEVLHNIKDTLEIGTGNQTNHLIILVEDSRKEDASLLKIAELICSFVDKSLTQNQSLIKTEFSCGIVPADSYFGPANQLFAAALAAAKFATQQGLPIYQFNPALAVELQRRQQITLMLPCAITEKTICPWWQPIMQNGQILAGFEALARWHTKEHGMISPGEFLPIARVAGLMPEMTRRILQQSLDMLANLQKNGLVDNSVYMSVNFDPEQIVQPQFEELLDSHIRKYGLQPHHLSIELVESSWLEESDVLLERLRKLREQGYKLALDDFGTGYSSLSMLNRLPFSTLKIDQSFVRNMLTNSQTKALVEATIAIGKALNINLVAEGIETEAEEAYITAAGVAFTQGYFRARPMSAELLLNWLEQRHR